MIIEEWNLMFHSNFRLILIMNKFLKVLDFNYFNYFSDFNFN